MVREEGSAEGIWDPCLLIKAPKECTCPCLGRNVPGEGETWPSLTQTD